MKNLDPIFELVIKETVKDFGDEIDNVPDEVFIEQLLYNANLMRCPITEGKFGEFLKDLGIAAKFAAGDVGRKAVDVGKGVAGRVADKAGGVGRRVAGKAVDVGGRVAGKAVDVGEKVKGAATGAKKIYLDYMNRARVQRDMQKIKKEGITSA